jgi:acetyltransferase-like isoleucine patch superfamily enzyme
LLKNILQRLILKTLPIEVIDDLISQSRIHSYTSNVTLGEGSKFYEESKVINLQNERSNICLGNNTHVRGCLQVFKQGGKILIGDYCYVGENSYIWSAGEIIIGNNVLIAHGVNIHDNISHPLNSTARHNDYLRILGLKEFPIEDFDLKAQKIIINNNVWIGFNSIILKGVNIGEGAIVGAGSVVTKDVPPFTIVAGNPAMVIRQTE